MGDHTLHARERELLHYLNGRHGTVTAKEISKKMAISERTIRSDIARINQAMETCGIFIRTVYGKGYQLEIQDRAVFHRLFSKEKNIETREDRIRYLIQRLVRGGSVCRLEDLEEDIYISRTTLENDLREVRARISENQPYLKMERSGNKLLVEEDELKRRNILIYLYCMDWDYNSRDGIQFQDAVVDKEIFDEIRDQLKQVLDESQIQLDDFGNIYLTIALAVCYARILEGKPLVLSAEWESWMISEEKERFFATARLLLERMSERWELSIGADESRWLASMLCQLRLLNFQYTRWKDALKMAENASLEMEKRLLAQIEEHYGMDFGEDENFRTNLLFHIQALRNGMISMQPQNQYVLNSLRAAHPYMGEIAHHMGRYLESHCGLRLGNREENYLLPLLVLFRNRRLEKLRRKRMRVAVVSHYNNGLSFYLMTQLQRIYGNRVELYGPYPVYDRRWAESVKPACILTTVQMDVFRRFEIPVLTVSPQFSQSEQEKLEIQIRKLEESCLYGNLPGKRSDYFRSNLMFQVQGQLELPQILKAMENGAQAEGFIKGETVSDLSHLYCTTYPNGLVFTYLSNEQITETVFCTAWLEHGISWRQQKGIHRVLLLLVKPEDRRFLGSFYLLARDVAEE